MPLFWYATILVNGSALIGALLFHYFESGVNSNIHSFVDSLSWSVGLITTIGHGNVVAVTFAGKVLSILMMIGGTIVLWTYMAFFVSALIAPELSRLEGEMEDVEQELKQIRQDVEKPTTEKK